MDYIKRGTKEFKKANIAFFAVGFSTFAILYSTQPLLPIFSKSFHVSPATASLSLSATTISLAVSLLIAGSLSEVLGRKSVMLFSMFSASVLTILTGFSPSFEFIVVLRILQGIVLSGLPAVAMAYLGEEIDRVSYGFAMGMFISGNALGGMSGRVIIGILADIFNWRIALWGIGVLSLLSSVLFLVELPPSKHFVPRRLEIKKLSISLISHLKNGKLRCLFGVGFLILGSLVSLYNYIGFDLISAPYYLSTTLVSFIFVIYAVGIFSSTWMGRLADKHGRKKTLYLGLIIMLAGMLMTLDASLVLKILGVALLTFGFFGSQSIASGWVGNLATHDKAQAAALYLFFYYVGSSIAGTASGTFWTKFGWNGIVGLVVLLILLAILLTSRLHKDEHEGKYGPN